MNQQAFKFKDATVTVLQPTIGSSTAADSLAYELAGGDGNDATTRELVEYRAFAEFLSFTTIDGKFPFALPSVDTPPEDLRPTLEQWRALPRSFLTRWNKALTEAEASDETP